MWEIQLGCLSLTFLDLSHEVLHEPPGRSSINDVVIEAHRQVQNVSHLYLILDNPLFLRNGPKREEEAMPAPGGEDPTRGPSDRVHCCHGDGDE